MPAPRRYKPNGVPDNYGTAKQSEASIAQYAREHSGEVAGKASTVEVRPTQAEQYARDHIADGYNARREATTARTEGLARVVEAIGRFFSGK